MLIFIAASVAVALATSVTVVLQHIDLGTMPRPWDATVAQVYCDIQQAGDDQIVAYATIVNPGYRRF